MNKELEEMQSALNKLDFYIWDNKETKTFEKQANKQIEILQKGLDDLKQSLERKEKLEKVWKIIKPIVKETTHFQLKKIQYYGEYYLVIDGADYRLKNETDFNLLKEMFE